MSKNKNKERRRNLGLFLTPPFLFGADSSLLYCEVEALKLSSLVIVPLQQSIDAIYMADIETRLSV